MDEPDFIAKANIGIVGLGLMGGSLALALREKCASVHGLDPDPAIRQLATEMMIIDSVSDNPYEVLPQADVILLAAPVGGILQTLEDLPAIHSGNAIIMDIGSTKSVITQAMENLPPRFDPIGGHPICGKEKLSLHNADKDLFSDAAFTFSPLSRTTGKARGFARQLAAALGARAIWLSAEEHDQILAHTSHAPYLLAAALALATPYEYSALCGSGFHSASRLAATPTSMMLDILKTNRQNVLAAVENVQEQLDHLSDALKSNDYSLLDDLLSQSAAQLKKLNMHKTEKFLT